jgi:DNA-binding GntR family transcriptional regulator
MPLSYRDQTVAQLPALSRRRTSDHVYEALRTAILSRSFAPGQRLNVHAIAKEMGVSLTPVKDALTRLEADAIVEIRPRSGTFVAVLQPDDVADAFEIRCALECLAAEKALARATSADVQRLRQLAQAIAEPSDDSRARLTHAARNAEFHKLIVALSGSRRLVQMYESLDAHIQIARVHLGHGDWKTRLASELEEHLAVVAAFDQGDAEGLVAALRSHIRRAADSLVRDLRNLGVPAAHSTTPVNVPTEFHAR